MTDRAGIDAAVERITAAAQAWVIAGLIRSHQLEGIEPEAARAALIALIRAELEAQARVPQGWQLVPKDPTIGMYDEWCAAGRVPANNDGWFGTWVASYEAMLAAAPASKEDE